jgi:pimeloyl-ACP methyl ester carboxylesterase
MSMAADDRYFAARGTNLRYRDDGRGSAIVLVHGWALDLDMWQPQVAGLIPPYRVIRWDRRGFGLSSGEPGIANDVADVRALCQHLGIKQAAFVGMSQGARVISALAAAAPSLIACLVFDGSPDLTSRPGRTANDVPLDRFRSLVSEGDSERFRNEWLSHPMSQLNTRDPAAQASLRTMIARYPANDLLQSHISTATEPALAAVISAQIPALVINGALDLQTRKDAGLELTRALPRSEHVSVSQAGHLANLDNPAAYNAVLRDFLDRHLVPAATAQPHL